MTALNADLDVDDELTLVRLAGDLDMASAPDVVTLATVALTRPGIETLVLDMTEVPFMDSTGIGALVTTRTLCDDYAVELQLHGVTSRVRRVLEISGLTDWFGIARAYGDSGGTAR